MRTWRVLGVNLWEGSRLVCRWGTFRFPDRKKAQPIPPNEADARLIEAAPELFNELVTLVGRCHELEKIFPQQAGMLRAMTEEAREAIAKSVQTEKSGQIRRETKNGFL